jgi:hypothetical protein
MPLASDRSGPEQAIEVESILRFLATSLNLNDSVSASPRGSGEGAGDHLKALTRANATASAEERATTFDAVAEFMYLWDARIQDTLAARGYVQIAAYRLGRGLAEVRWQLDPTVTEAQDVRSLKFLVGSGRQQELSQYLTALTGYLSPLSAGVARYSLSQWNLLLRALISLSPLNCWQQWRIKSGCGMTSSSAEHLPNPLSTDPEFLHRFEAQRRSYELSGRRFCSRWYRLASCARALGC